MIDCEIKGKCSGCGACASVCPNNCITMKPDSEGFLYPCVDEDKCASCGMCVQICPVIHPVSVENRGVQAFAAYSLNDHIRENSSSGGLFTLLAEQILNDGVVVFGAAFTHDFRAVHHIGVENAADLASLRGSKYLQSSAYGCYAKAKQCLDEGRPVMFTGTPCQIGGLKAYLGKDYPQLYTQDIICHGAPSPKVWAEYVAHREREAGAKTKNVFFRHKKYGWKSYCVNFDFSNCTQYSVLQRDDLFMRGFLADLYLRPSCHNCAFKGINRASDITLADFWGIDRLLPDMDDDKGTSLVIIHSEKGQRLFEALKGQLKCKAVDASRAVQSNAAAVKSAKAHKKREEFFSKLGTQPLEQLISRCLYRSPFVRAKSLLVRIYRKINRTLFSGRTA